MTTHKGYAMAVNTRWVDVPSENGKMAVFVAEPAAPGRYPGLAYFHIVLGANAPASLDR